MQIPYNNFVSNLSNNLQNNYCLEKVIAAFQQYYNLTPVIGVEIEFYLSSDIDITEFETLSNKYLIRQKISAIKKEKGNNQFEINLPPSTNLINYAKTIGFVKETLKDIAEKLSGNINFLAKPFLQDYGSSMHFHINFLTSSKSITFDFINSAAQSLCHYMLDTFVIFMPKKEDYRRLDKNYMAPTHVSFGGNNRSVAIRIPDSFPPRLEHRLAGSEVDPYIAIFTILNSILLGLKFPDRIANHTKIYGNAFDPQYSLPLLPTSFEEALKLFTPDFFNISFLFDDFSI